MDKPRLTERGRRSLTERLRRLEDERIPALERDALATGDAAVTAALATAREEADDLRRTLAQAAPLEEASRTPGVVELGDTVTIRPEGGGPEERYTVVGELEARVDDAWISEESPMGIALLGGRPGDVVEVRAPGGAARYAIVAIEAADALRT